MHKRTELVNTFDSNMEHVVKPYRAQPMHFCIVTRFNGVDGYSIMRELKTGPGGGWQTSTVY
jgi:hypothetical protein